MNNISDIIILVTALFLFIIMVIIIRKSDKQFRDKSLDLKEGMNEADVMETMEKDPISIDTLKDDIYVWTFERKDWKGWGTQIITAKVYFDITKRVTKIERSVSYDRPGMRKQ